MESFRGRSHIARRSVWGSSKILGFGDTVDAVIVTAILIPGSDSSQRGRIKQVHVEELAGHPPEPGTAAMSRDV
jgi:hypothetical protein